MARKTITLLENSGTNLDLVGDAVPGDSYYGFTDGLHTVAVYGQGLIGRVRIQGTLATNPTEDDWFDISGSTFTADQSTLISTANFTGNFVWVRAKATSVTAGTISSVLINS